MVLSIGPLDWMVSRALMARARALPQWIMRSVVSGSELSSQMH